MVTELKIPGVESNDKFGAPAAPPPPAFTQPPIEDPAPILLNKARREKSGLNGAMLLAVLALIVGLGAGAYAYTLQKQVVALRAALVQVNTLAGNALKTAQAVPPPRDFTPEIGKVEAALSSRCTRLEEYQQRVLPEEISKKIAASESKYVAETKDLTNQVARATATVQALHERSQQQAGNIKDIVIILRNQDKLLRGLVQPAEEAPEEATTAP